MFHVIVNLIDQGIPVSDIPAGFLKIRRLDDILEEHGVEMKRVIGAPRGNQIFGAVGLSFWKRKQKKQARNEYMSVT
jgi:hypothetical protein